MRLGTTAFAITAPSEVAVMNTPMANPRSFDGNHCEINLTPAE
jgi:hypothetical protein